MPSILVLDITDHDAKVLQLSNPRKQELRLETAQRISFEDLERSDENLPERAQRIAAAVKKIPGPTTNIVVIVPKQFVTLRNTLLPTSDPEEISSMVFFEAEKMIPFNVERHTLSFCILESPALQGTEVMIGAIDEPIITQWVNHIKPLRGELKAVEVSSLALQQSVLATQAGQGLPTVYAILQIGISNMDVVIIKNNQILLSRSIRFALKNLLEKIDASYTLEHATESDFQELFDSNQDFAKAVEDWFKKLFTNYQKTIEFASRESQLPMITTVFVSGEALCWPGFFAHFRDRVGFSCIQLNPVEGLEREPKSIIENQWLPSFASSYGAAHRALLGENSEAINLLPYAIIKQQQQAEQKMHIAITVAMSIVLILIGYLYFSGQQQYRDEESKRLNEYLLELDDLVQQLDDREERISIIRNIRSEQAGALDILGKISSYGQLGSFTLDNKRLNLSRFEYKLGDEVRMEGYAKEVDDITNFVRYLSGLQNDGKPIFSDVRIQSQDPTTLPRREDRLYRYLLVAELTVERKS
ncbi:MAG: pilus assembly protein PilM [Sumerlaeia bacterium]